MPGSSEPDAKPAALNAGEERQYKNNGYGHSQSICPTDPHAQDFNPALTTQPASSSAYLCLKLNLLLPNSHLIQGLRRRRAIGIGKGKAKIGRRRQIARPISTRHFQTAF